MQPKNTTLEAEQSLKVRMMLEFRFGDGSGEPNLQIDLATKEMLSLLRRTRESAKKEERQRIAKHMEPAFNDFSNAAHKMISSGVLAGTGSEILENLGYMRSGIINLEDTPSK